MEYYEVAIICLASILITFLFSWYLSSRIGKQKIKGAEVQAEKVIREAEKEAASTKKEKLLEVKDEWYNLKNKFEQETKDKRKDIERQEKILANREISIDRKADLLNKTEQELKQREREVQQNSKDIEQKNSELKDLIEQETEQLERIAGLTSAEAKKMLTDNLIDKAKQDAAMMIKEIRENAKLTANREAREIIVSSIERSASDHSVENSVSVVQLPGDDMKGRIIGREGRNIRAFETATGVEIIVDDTPEAVVLSAFDPIRREIAKMSLEVLVSDGRIHPARIEDVVEKAKKDMDEIIIQAGEQACLDANVPSPHPEMIKLLGRMKFRTSYGQNVLAHSVEVSRLCGLMASSLGIDAGTARRAGLLHDIGKAIDKDVDGTHTEIGVELAKRYNEGPVVVNSIASHHEDVEAISPIAVLVKAADAISGSRPGARRDTLEGYIKRLEKLEKVAESFAGVSKTYAIQAGREIRVIVEPEKVDDIKATQLAEDISAKIQSELEYPGQIKVTVIREYRAVDYAK